MICELTKGDTVGTLKYDVTESGRVTFSIKHPDKVLRRKLSRYLGKTDRQYRTPVSSSLDDDILERAVPIENLDFFERALCEVFHRFGVWVQWEGGK